MAMELPEVFVICNQLKKEIMGKTIKDAKLIPTPSLIRDNFVNKDGDKFAADLKDKMINNVYISGRWMFVDIEPEHLILLISLQGSGKILFHKDIKDAPKKYTVGLTFDDNSVLSIIIGSFGFAKLIRAEELEMEEYPGRLGISPIDKNEFTYNSFDRAVSGFTRTLKDLFINQRTISGIGNGYLQDILFTAGLHPKRKANELNNSEKRVLYDSIINITEKAMELGGRTTEYDLYDKPGSYEPILDKNALNKPCPNCGGDIIKLNIAGTASYICENCQK